jgi:5-methyltetrahydrofolate--homocysteine methyltransferase
MTLLGGGEETGYGGKMKLSDLLADKQRVVFIDGAMGTQLAQAGVEMGGQSNLGHPDAVLAVHLQYVECGADLIITNTFTMNRVNVESHGIKVDVRDVNLAGAKLARKAAGADCWVLGDMGSTGKMLKPHGDLTEEAAYAAYREQASILIEGGVDGLIVETMFDLREALCALRACRDLGDVPVIVSMTFNTLKNGGRTVMGDSARDCAAALTKAGANAIGTNCGGLDPKEVGQIVSWMKEASPLPLVAQPNAGRPRMVGGETVFDMSPADFASGTRACVEAGAHVLGGCCGTSPAHIKALRSAIEDR